MCFGPPTDCSFKLKVSVWLLLFEMNNTDQFPLYYKPPKTTYDGICLMSSHKVQYGYDENRGILKKNKSVVPILTVSENLFFSEKP